jgi:glutamine amidotransferase
MAALRKRGLVEPIREFCAGGRPFLGICLGLQVLFEESEEVAEAPIEVAAMLRTPLPKGLGILRGRVARFSGAVVRQGLKVPHMGWNAVEAVRPWPLFHGMPEERVYFYFAHSYYACPAEECVVAARTDYGGPFASAVWAGNIHATQFHPEKSQAVGLAMLKNFVTRT